MSVSAIEEQQVTGSPVAHFDVLIVGAGVSGIGCAYHLQHERPGKSYVILEAREATGGTWDLFRYPGIRSDSDLHTFGYAFKPWKDEKAIADGPSILRYIRETASENGIDGHIRFGHRVLGASLVEQRQPLDGHAVQHRHRRDRAVHVLLAVRRRRLLPLRAAATRPTSRAASASRAPSSIRSTGRRTSTTPASASS